MVMPESIEEENHLNASKTEKKNTAILIRKFLTTMVLKFTVKTFVAF
jgi:hypothetical protein